MCSSGGGVDVAVPFAVLKIQVTSVQRARVRILIIIYMGINVSASEINECANFSPRPFHRHHRQHSGPVFSVQELMY